MNGPLVLKLGGELLEKDEGRSEIAALCAAIAAERPLVVVHGGGQAIDAELERREIQSRKVDGLRITDAPTLDAVVSVLAGSANTTLVAALVARGVPAVGLTGVDAGFGRAVRTDAHRSAAGTIVDLGFVGDPGEVDASLVELLLVHGYVPVIASLGIDAGAAKSGEVILNINADVMACRIAAALGGSELVIAGTTPGVLGADGDAIALLDVDGIEQLISSGTASAGMVAKLTACRAALNDGVTSVRIVDGRGFGPAYGVSDAPGTTLTRESVTVVGGGL